MQEYRTVLDRFSSVHWYSSIVNGPRIPYDREFMESYKSQIERRKQSKRFKGGWVMSWNLDGNNNWVDWQPYGHLTMNCHANFNRILAQEDNLDMSNYMILYGDNFLPYTDDYKTNKALRRQLGLWFEFKKGAHDYYRRIMEKHKLAFIPVNEEPLDSLKYLEVALEFPDVWNSEIAEWFTTGEGRVFEYHGKSQSRTRYYKPFRKSDGFSIKSYQKTLEFARLELSFWGDSLNMFTYCEEPSELISELNTLVDRTLDRCALDIRRLVDFVNDKNPSEIMGWFADRVKLHPKDLMNLGNMVDEGALFESNRHNQGTLRKLRRRCIIEPYEQLVHDRSNAKAPKKVVRGSYRFTNEFTTFWKKINS